MQRLGGFHFGALVVLFCLRIEGSVVAQDWQERHRAAFEAFESCSKIEDFLRHAANAPFNDPVVRETLLYQVAYESLRPGFSRDVDHQRFTLRLAIFAVLLSLAAEDRLSAWPLEEDLYSLGPASFASLERNAGFGSDEEALRRLIRRRPAVEEPPGDGYYVFLQFRNVADGTYIVLERTDFAWRGLGPSWRIEQGKAAAQESPALPVEGDSFRFPLPALPNLALAGKVYLLIDLLGHEKGLIRYLSIVAGNAFYALGSGDGTYESPALSRLGEYPFQEALRAFVEEGPEGALINREVLQDRLTTVRFFSGRYQAALEDYLRVAGDSAASPWSRAAAQWGATICLLGLEKADFENALQELDRRMVQIKKAEAGSDRYNRYSYSLRALLDALGRSPTPAAGGEEVLTGTMRARANFDLFRIFHALDRPDLSIRLVMRELKRGRELRPPDAEAVVRERIYLRELGASLNDLFSHLSWRRVEWAYQPVQTDISAWERDFASTPLDDLRGGCRGSKRYGACSPEEDRATAGELYSTPRDEYVLGEVRRLFAETQDMLGVPPESTFPPTAVDFRVWVSAELATEPTNYEPLLKLIGLEWFFFPLAGLQDQSVDFKTWRYQPLKESGMTEPVSARERLVSARQGLSARSRLVWEVFLEARAFLDRFYGVPSAAPSAVSRPVLFVCEHGSAKSVVAAAHFNRVAAEKELPFRAVSRGTDPDKEMSPAAVQGLLQDRLQPGDPAPTKLSQPDLDNAMRIVSFCDLPAEYHPTTEVERWEVPPVSTDYAASRDAMLVLIEKLLSELSVK